LLDGSQSTHPLRLVDHEEYIGGVRLIEDVLQLIGCLQGVLVIFQSEPCFLSLVRVFEFFLLLVIKSLVRYLEREYQVLMLKHVRAQWCIVEEGASQPFSKPPGQQVKQTSQSGERLT
jgi:hypothetical protein